VVAIDGGEDQRVEPGTAVLLPGGLVHMHGAADDGFAWHLSIMVGTHGDFDCPIPEAWTKWRR
jgi:quercetin dioxygenase-like cupin family protein